MSETGVEYTIDETSAASGVPSRTIRFYQAKGLLPAPRKQGRVALYGPQHLERLRLISELQERGLRLRAIREVLSRPNASNETLQEWLGVRDRVDGFQEEGAQTCSEAELQEWLGSYMDKLPELVDAELIERHGTAEEPLFTILSPSLLRIALALGDAGIAFPVAAGLREILEQRLAQAADEMVRYAIQHIGQGFGRSDAPKDVEQAIEALLPNAPGGDGVRVIFGREVSRAAAEQMQDGVKVMSKHFGTDGSEHGDEGDESEEDNGEDDPDDEPAGDLTSDKRSGDGMQSEGFADDHDKGGSCEATSLITDHLASASRSTA